MRRIGKNSELMAKARLVVTVLVLAGAKLAAQEQQQAVRQIVVSVPDRKLALIENGEVKKVYSIAVGTQKTPSPNGEFKIVTRITGPTYYAPGKVISPGPQNPLGTRWIGLNQKGYGIHGTNAPKSIGKAASHGCIRMAKKDVEELFNLVRPGDRVQIVSERNELTAQLFNTMEPVIVASASTTEMPEIHNTATASTAGLQ